MARSGRRKLRTHARGVALLALLGVVALGYGVSRGEIAPGIEALGTHPEPVPASKRPPPPFPSLSRDDRLSAAWNHADQGDVSTALGAANHILNADPRSTRVEEALCLSASLETRHLESPWRAVVAPRRQLDRRPEGRYAPAAQAVGWAPPTETNTKGGHNPGGRCPPTRLGRVGKATMQLERMVENRAAGFGTDAQALLRRLEGKGGVGAAHQKQPRGSGERWALPTLRSSASWFSSLLPNNLRSLALSFLGFAAAFMPSMFKLGLKLHDGSDPGAGHRVTSVLHAFRARFRSPAFRWLFVCFVVAMVFQYRWNLEQERSGRAELKRVVAGLDVGE